VLQESSCTGVSVFCKVQRKMGREVHTVPQLLGGLVQRARLDKGLAVARPEMTGDGEERMDSETLAYPGRIGCWVG
jgi:hypothetical protein